jgi:hypothetical protein
MAIRLSLGARFRRQSLAPRGATLAGLRGLTAQRGQAEVCCPDDECKRLGLHLTSLHGEAAKWDIELSEEGETETTTQRAQRRR